MESQTAVTPFWWNSDSSRLDSLGGQAGIGEEATLLGSELACGLPMTTTRPKAWEDLSLSPKVPRGCLHCLECEKGPSGFLKFGS